MADVLLLAVCVSALTLAFVLSPGAERVAMLGWEIPELCAVKRLTGYPCPGCGLTRSWVYLAHGQVWTAVTMNVFGPILFLTAAVQVPLRIVRLVRRGRRRKKHATQALAAAGEDSCPAS